MDAEVLDVEQEIRSHALFLALGNRQKDGHAEDLPQSHTLHTIRFESDSILGAWYGAAEAEVNSLHGQGVRELAPSLVAEARAPDGLIEAFRVRDAKNFAMAVQWHPEWQYQDNRLSQTLFSAFARACQQRQQSRHF